MKSRVELRPKSRLAPLTSRTPSRRCPLKATAVTAQLRSTASACASESSDMVSLIASEGADIREHPVPEPDDQSRSAPCGDVAQDLPYPVHFRPPCRWVVACGMPSSEFQAAHGGGHQLGQHRFAGVEVAHGGQHA